MIRIPERIFGNIAWKVKNVSQKDGIVTKKNVKITKNIFTVTSHKNAYLGNGFVMEPFNVPLLQKMKHLNFVRHKRHFLKEQQSNVWRALDPASM